MKHPNGEVLRTPKCVVSVRDGFVLFHKADDPGERFVKTPVEAQLLADLLDQDAPKLATALRAAARACRRSEAEART
jgi:hypothetical protein